jgi:hypothetical protein
MRFPVVLLLFVFSAVAVFAQDQSSPPQASISQTSPAGDTSKAEPEKTPAIDLTPDANGGLSQEQMMQLFHIVADKDIENDKLSRNYTYTERDIEHDLDGKGQTKKTETKTYEVLDIYGEQVQRLIEKDGKPLDAKDAAKEEEKIQKIIDKRKNESEAERKKREEKEAKDREDGRKFVKEIADAYNFKLLGTELVDGREAWMIEGEPRPGFQPHMKFADKLPKFHGRVWIDKADLQMSKLDVEALDTISFGLVLARLHKGTRFMMEQTRVNDEVWLPRHVTFKFDARVALFKGYKMDGEQTFSDYKKFGASSKIVGFSGNLSEPPVVPPHR